MPTSAPPRTLSLTHRPRRLRRTAALRALVRETRLSPDQFLYPLFIVEGEGIRREIPSLPGVFHLSVDEAVREATAARGEGVAGVLLFGLPAHKDAQGSAAWDAEAPVQRATRALVREVPGLLVVTDVCLCEYTSHGHCGLIAGEEIVNDATVDLLAKAAVSHADAGAHIVAPSDMMDGRVAYLRRTLDDEGLADILIMAYSAKFASAFYGPFREAADSTPQFGDRQSYQMDPPNAREAMREIETDIAEGADIVMVKPALAYLDLVRQARDRFGLPIAAYNVSGEYAMVKAAAQNGWIDEQRVTMEILTGIKRAGADLIITYSAKDACKWLCR
jgi:porphobilinogen synthase